MPRGVVAEYIRAQALEKHSFLVVSALPVPMKDYEKELRDKIASLFDAIFIPPPCNDA